MERPNSVDKTKPLDDAYQKAASFIRDVIENNRLGYIYSFPDKRLYLPAEDPKTFIENAWNGYEGEIGIYIHVPYCTPKPPPDDVKQSLSENNLTPDGRDYLCGYCNLFTTVASEVPSTFTQNVVREIDLYRPIFENRKLKPRSLYFGGGSPSLLTEEDLRTIVDSAEQLLGAVPNDKERAIECIPDSVNYGKLKAIRDIGFNRVSIGVQTFDEKVLHYAGRNYDPSLAYQAIAQALEIGFANVNGDLIIGLPQATRDTFLRDIETMIELGPHTVTLYQDMLRPITRFGKQAEAGILPRVSQEEIYKWSMAADERLRAAGYNRRTLTCWAKGGGGYQQGEDIYSQIPIIGFGPGARSYGTNANYSSEYAVSTKLANLSIYQWQRSIERGEFPQINGYVLSEDIKNRAAVIFGLMTEQGIDSVHAKNLFGSEIAALEDANLVVEEEGLAQYEHK